MTSIMDSLQYLKGVGPKRYERLKSLGLYTVRDLLEYYPRSYDDQSNFKKLYNCVENEKASFDVLVTGVGENRRVRKNLSITSFYIEDDSGRGIMSFFNMPYLKDKIILDRRYLLNGKISYFHGQAQVSNPKIELKEKSSEIGNIMPIYALKKGITNNDILKLVKQVINLDLFEEFLPEEIIKKYKLMSKNEAIREIHFPTNRRNYLLARNRLVFEELFLFQLNIFQIKNIDKDLKAFSMNANKKVYDFINSLPFKLTKGQNGALEEIFSDMQSGKRMNRLLQGDVGSGKTIIAIISMYLAYTNGYQSTIMAPTEILAKQHYESFINLLQPLGVNVELLVGSTTKKNKERILEDIQKGKIDIVIGTHALLEENVRFKKLGLNITDEQHRFGVRQRENLNTKSNYAHTLVMTATPIPRTLALIIYGDLSISTINTMPPNRKEISTIAINTSMIERALNFINDEIEKGRQAYIICPLIEESEVFDLNSAIKVYEDLTQNKFRDKKVGLLHGKMSANEKNEIMELFSKGKIDIIVSTTVIEVGVNVPNASVILIYNAERFGLAQLHQLRGRVGRGEHQSYCILYNESKSEISWQRMKVMTESTDGFYIANKDMELRGSGDIFGTRQSGDVNFKIADLSRDMNILKYAQFEAKNIIDKDNKLQNDENKNLKDAMIYFYKVNYKILN